MLSSVLIHVSARRLFAVRHGYQTICCDHHYHYHYDQHHPSVRRDHQTQFLLITYQCSKVISSSSSVITNSTPHYLLHLYILSHKIVHRSFNCQFEFVCVKLNPGIYLSSTFGGFDLNPCTSPLQGLYDMLSNLLVRYDDPMLPPLNKVYKVFKVDGHSSHTKDLLVNGPHQLLQLHSKLQQEASCYLL